MLYCMLNASPDALFQQLDASIVAMSSVVSAAFGTHHRQKSVLTAFIVGL